MNLFLSKLLAPALSPLLIVCGLLLIAILAAGRRPRTARGAAVAALVVLLVAGNWWFARFVASCLELRNLPDGPLPKAAAHRGAVVGSGTGDPTPAHDFSGPE